MTESRPPRPRVWDLPLRVFHVLLAGLGVAAFVTGDEAARGDLHVALGVGVAVLLAFRLAWGVVGTRHARLRALLVPPRELVAHLRALAARRAPASDGHPPQAAWAVLALLGLLAALVVTGALVLAGEEQAGPLAGGISVAAGLDAHAVHRALAWAGVAWVALHLAGVAKESLRLRTNLPASMVTGRKAGAAGPDVPAHRGTALLLAAGVGAVMALLPPANPHAPAAPVSEAWTAECGACHLAYDPALLPARSWTRMLDEQHAHFGEDLLLVDAVVVELRTWAAAHAAEAGRNEAAARIAASVPAAEAPQRITELAYWRDTHAGLGDDVFARPDVGARLRCTACHRDADEGRWDARHTDVPTGAPRVTAAREAGR